MTVEISVLRKLLQEKAVERVGLGKAFIVIISILNLTP